MERPATIGTGTKLKWLLFRILEWLSEFKSVSPDTDGRRAAREPALPEERGTAPMPRPLWVFVSTIGELNAIGPFLKRLLAEMGPVPLVLLTDHPHYRDSFLAQYPEATIRRLDHRSATAAALVEEQVPRLMILAEIPCLLSDAPCRLPFALLYELKRRDVPVCMVNGWLYQEAPDCTMDHIEKSMFGREYLQLFDLMTVQDEVTRSIVATLGADLDRVFVTGNIKFDAAVAAAEWHPAQGSSPVTLSSIVESGRPTVIGGCVTDVPEQIAALDALVAVRREIPDTLLVLAPRHPEFGDRMETLRELLAERGISHAFKSATGDVPVPRDLACLVLDTMGELKDFYAAGTIAYVGRNHNVLEPLAFGKPVVVTPTWNKVYPSFPVYWLLYTKDAITQVEPGDLGKAWLELLRDPVAYSSRQQKTSRLLEALKGATARNAELLARFDLLRETSRS